VRDGEPGASYVAALRRWPDEIAQLTRTTLAERLGLSLQHVSGLLTNTHSWKATPNLLKHARKIIEMCGGTIEDIERWTTYHHQVTTCQVTGGATPWPDPPGPVGLAEAGPPRTENGDAAERRLRKLSGRLAVELDVSSSQPLDGDQQHLLSAGLYVRRTQQDAILDLLRPGGYDKPVLVHGVAGEGKSSLLWGLHEELKSNAVLEPYLLNSPWLTGIGGGTPAVPVDELLHVAERARARDRVVVFLIDTVDLLLHDELHRQQILDLCETLAEPGAEVVLTSRPEEALTLPKALFRTVGLRPYDEVELPQAIDKHVAAFCPQSLTAGLDEKIRLIVNSAARGLTVREIVLNPLKLRLLFELYQPDFPSLEHDVSSLYEMYWERRVRTDQRGEVGIADGTDLSLPAEHAAIALLAAGRTELGERLLLRSAASVAMGRHGNRRDYQDVLADTKAGAAELARRGVLIRSGQTIRYFHQTMFEYAAAVGLLDRDREQALTFLVDHLKAHPDDLFVGAVAEQALILALDDPLVASAAVAILDDMAASGAASLQRIALGVLAHQPSRQETTERLLDSVDAAALRRYAQTVPTVAKADVAHQVAMLTRVWRYGEPVRESVLEALERLSARNAAIVVSTVRELECVPVALSWKDAPARMVKLVARVLVAAAEADPTWARQQLLVLFDAMIADSTHRNVPLHLLELLADHWAVLGSGKTAADIESRIVQSQEKHDAAASEMRRALGRIQALAWRDRLSARQRSSDPEPDEWWTQTVEDLCERLEGDYYDVLANARLHAVADLITWGSLGVPMAMRTVERLNAMPGFGAFALGRTLFPQLLSAENRVGDHPVAVVIPVVLALLGGLPAPGNRPAAGAQRLAHAVRQALHDADLPTHRLAALLADVPAAGHMANWFADDHLAVLLVPAAVGGHQMARAALNRVATDFGLLSEVGRKNVSYDLVRHVDTHPWLMTLLIELSVWRESATPLSEVVVASEGEVLAQLSAHSTRLVKLVDLLFAGTGAAQRDAASLWRRLRQVGAVPAPDHQELVRRFKATPEQAARGNIVDLAVDLALDDPPRYYTVDRMLRELFRVNSATHAVMSPRDNKTRHIATAARAAWLRLVCRGCPTDDVDTNELLAIATATPASADNLVVFGQLIARLACQGNPTAAAELLLRVTDTVRSIKLSPKQENGLANKLRPAIRMIFRSATADAQRALLARIPNLPRTHARVLVAAAAQENFYTLRPTLTALLDGGLPDGVAQQIHDDIRVRSRSAASGALPRLILPLADDVPRS
jgi:hypothetical protein